MKENSNIPRKELPERLQVSESAIQKHIVFLKEQGIITREGGNKYGKWKVIEVIHSITFIRLFALSKKSSECKVSCAHICSKDF